MTAVAAGERRPLRRRGEACLSFGDTSRAAELLAVIQPWAEQLLVVTAGTSIEGASDRSIGHLLATLGRLDEGDERYTAAARLERDGGFPHSWRAPSSGTPVPC